METQTVSGAGLGRGVAVNQQPGKTQLRQRKTIVGKLLQKASRTATTISLAPIRAAWLAAMKLNALKIGGKLRFGYLTSEAATYYGYNKQKWTIIRQQFLKAEQRFVKAGGRAEDFKTAILKGNGNRGKAVSLNGLETYWRVISNKSGLSGTGAGASGSSVVDLIGAILQAIAAILDKVKPGPIEEDEE